MQEIKLSVDDKNLDTILTILNSLKSGLIDNIETTQTKRKHTAYKPKTNQIIYEAPPATSTLSGKYANPSAYKERLRKSK